MRIRLLSRLLVILGILLAPLSADAHPMGNFSVNHYAKISIENGSIEIRYLIDMAEIPTYQEMQQGGFQAQPGDAALKTYLAAEGEQLKGGLLVKLDGKNLVLKLISREVIFPAGAGGLPTMKMGFLYRAALPVTTTGQAINLKGPPGPISPGSNPQTTPMQLEYSDNNFPGHAGWKEIVVAAPAGTLVTSSVPQTDRSQQLSNYPTDLLNSPPQDLSASITFKNATAPAPAAQANRSLPAIAIAGNVTAKRQSLDSSAGAAAVPAPVTGIPPSSTGQPATIQPDRDTTAPLQLQANKQATPHSAFTELITSRNFGFWFLFTAALIAFGLGAMHALEPGHGKTIVAAYLVGSRGTARHAVLLGIIVTASHTAGVFALGAVTLYASHYIVPEQLYPWLGVISGLTIAGLGIYLLLRRWAGADADHTHAPGEANSHWTLFGKHKEAVPAGVAAASITTDEWAGSGETAPANAAAIANSPVSLYQLLVLGITGGMIPCPAALVVLLSAFALHRVGFGLFLIVAFSVGLATVLIGIGLLMVYGRRYFARYKTDGPLVTRWLPMASSSFMVILGSVIAVRALLASGISSHSFTKERLGPFLFVIGLGLILGMRHSTDPDHVVAVSTFVSKQISVRSAALIGVLWGLGHTITIFLVGAAIIIFGVVIPPRIGLSMEFSVALMLILLGTLNLAGVTPSIVRRFKRGQPDTEPDPDGLAASKLSRNKLYRYARPLAVGLVHGLAGSAAVALLVLSTIHDPLWATMYLLVFGAGTLVGMMIMTGAMAVPIAYSGRRFVNTGKYLRLASGAVSVCFGLFLVYQIGYLGGLFGSSPQWTPH